MPRKPNTKKKGMRRVLSMWQPYASLLASGIKKWETRNSDHKFRGEFLIHASGTIPREAYDSYLQDPVLRSHVHKFLGFLQGEDVPPLGLTEFRKSFVRGAIIGKANLVKTVPAFELVESLPGHHLNADWLREWSLGDLSSDRWAWICENPEQFDTPTPAKGHQTLLWTLPAECVIYG